LDHAPKEQLLDQKPSDAGLAGPSVVGKEKPDSRKGKVIPIHGLQLVRKRIPDARLHGKEGVVFTLQHRP
jgi:hypothetical protein